MDLPVVLKVNAKDETTNEFECHEFIWINSHSNIFAQGTYVGVEMIDNFLNFYLVNPIKKIIHLIKSYQIIDSVKDNINREWFVYKESPDKYKLTVFPPYGENGVQIITDQFVIYRRHEDVKILEINIPINYITFNKVCLD